MPRAVIAFLHEVLPPMSWSFKRCLARPSDQLPQLPPRIYKVLVLHCRGRYLTRSRAARGLARLNIGTSVPSVAAEQIPGRFHVMIMGPSSHEAPVIYAAITMTVQQVPLFVQPTSILCTSICPCHARVPARLAIPKIHYKCSAAQWVESWKRLHWATSSSVLRQYCS